MDMYVLRIRLFLYANVYRFKCFDADLKLRSLVSVAKGYFPQVSVR